MGKNSSYKQRGRRNGGSSLATGLRDCSRKHHLALLQEYIEATTKD